MTDHSRICDPLSIDPSGRPAGSLKALAADLALARQQLQAIASRSRDGAVEAALTRLTAAVDSLHARLAGRGQEPLERAFAPLRPLIEEIGGSFGEEITLGTSGGNIAVDRRLIDGLRAPLAQLVRACTCASVTLSHAPRASSRPGATIRVAAMCCDDHLMVTVANDGAALDLAQIGAAALRWGLIDDAELAGMTPPDLADLVFAPGFATAAQVTGMRGEAVALDAVRADIAALGGTVTVATGFGSGTVFTVGLPLRQVVAANLAPASRRARTLLFTAGSPDVKALPLSLIKRIETVQPADIERSAGRLVIRRDDGLLALLPLVEGTPVREEEQPVLIVEAAGHTFGLLVDEVLDITEADDPHATMRATNTLLAANGRARQLARELVALAPRAPEAAHASIGRD